MVSLCLVFVFQPKRQTPNFERPFARRCEELRSIPRVLNQPLSTHLVPRRIQQGLCQLAKELKWVPALKFTDRRIVADVSELSQF